MNTKWNLLVVFALLAALVGGTTTPAQAEEPQHYFTWSPAEPQEGVDHIYFTATPPSGVWSLKWDRSTNPGGTTCDQNFGGYNLTPSSEFFQSEDYLVCLTIYMSENDPNPIVDTQTVTLTNLPPVIGQTYSGARGGLVYYASADTHDQDWDRLVTCTVDYGDGTGPQPSELSLMSCDGPDHEYEVEGTYIATITLSEQGFDPVSATVTINVVNVPVQHSFTWSPASPVVGEDVTFSLVYGDPPADYSILWTRSSEPGGTECNATIGTEVSPVTSFAAAGDYKVCLAVFYGGQPWVTDSQVVTVVGAPLVLSNPTVTPATTIAGYPITTASVTFSNYVSGLTCTIDFGDGTIETGIVSGSTCTDHAHVYAGAGTYTVTFTVSEPGVGSVTAETTHTVVEPYANAVLGTSGTVQNPEAALHAPDGVFASIRSSSAIGLALAAPVQGAMLTVYHSTRSPSCTVSIDNSGSPQVIGATAYGADHSIFAVPAQVGSQLYFAIQCGTLAKKAVFELDAFQVEPIALPAGYAIWALSMDEGAQNPGAAVGVPDQVYATIPETGGMILMDMDIPMQQGILTIYHSPDSPACQVLLGMQLPIGTTLPGASSTSLIVGIPPEIQVPYFAIQCAAADKAVFKLDAAQFQLSLEPTGYAVAAGAYFAEFGYIGDAQDPGAATGEPDGQYATTSPQSSNPDIIPGIVVDMGDMVHGTMLTVYHSTQSASCGVFTLTDSGEPSEMLGSTIVDAESSTFGISQDFRYILIVCSAGDVLELDAVHFEATTQFSGYAISVLDADASIKDATAALGAPDGKYAIVPALTGSIILDLGTQFSGLLTITHASGNPACGVYGIQNLIESQPILIGFMMSGLTYTILPVSTDQFPTGIRYLMIDCQPVQKGSLSLDAVKVEPAPTPTGYGLSVFAISGNVKNQDAALGEPNNSYATIGYPGGDIGLYMAPPYTGMLTVYHSTTSPSCTILVGDDRGNFQGSWTTTAGATSTTVDLQGVNITFVGVSCSSLTKRASFQLDAVQVIPPP